MFDHLFERPHALNRQLTRPMARERVIYLRHLEDQGMARSTLRTVAEYLVAVVEYLHVADRPGEAIGLTEIAQKSKAWSRAKGSRCSRARFYRHATQWLEFLGRLQRPVGSPDRYAENVTAYADYMRSEKALSPKTISYRCGAVQAFLAHLEVPICDITIRDIDRALVEKVTRGGYARVTVQTYASTLRTFFRFAETRGWCHVGLAAAIKGPRVFAQEPLPVGPSWADVQRLFAATRGNRPTDIRDRAIIMLLAVYGLRSGEVVSLRLDDFDWERERLFVTRSKQRHAQTYPLTRTVGDAVLRYLKKVRPRCMRREVFLTRRAPFRPLQAGLWQIVARRLRALHISLPHCGPHSLRHACATHLLNQGLSLKEIGDHLGHRHPDTTRIYAKVDLVGLRQVADFDLGGIQ